MSSQFEPKWWFSNVGIPLIGALAVAISFAWGHDTRLNALEFNQETIEQRFDRFEKRTERMNDKIIDTLAEISTGVDELKTDLTTLKAQSEMQRREKSRSQREQ